MAQDARKPIGQYPRGGRLGALEVVGHRPGRAATATIACRGFDPNLDDRGLASDPPTSIGGLSRPVEQLSPTRPGNGRAVQ